MHTIEGSWSGLAKPALRYNDPESSTAGSIAANPAPATPIPSWFGKNHIRFLATEECTSAIRLPSEKSATSRSSAEPVASCICGLQRAASFIFADMLRSRRYFGRQKFHVRSFLGCISTYTEREIHVISTFHFHPFSTTFV